MTEFLPAHAGPQFKPASDSRDFSKMRRAMLGVVAAAGVSSLAGCASWFRREPRPVCPQLPEVSFPEGPLTIDAHCHVFNGTDLQVRDFLSKVAVKQGGGLGVGANALGSILQALVWSFAPDGKTELEALKGMAPSIQACKAPEISSGLATMRQQGYSAGREQLQGALRRSAEFRSLFEALSRACCLCSLMKTQRPKSKRYVSSKRCPWMSSTET